MRSIVLFFNVSEHIHWGFAWLTQSPICSLCAIGDIPDRQMQVIVPNAAAAIAFAWVFCPVGWRALCIHLGASLPSIIAMLAQQVMANKHPGQHHASDETANMRPEGHPADVVTNAIQSADKLDG